MILSTTYDCCLRLKRKQIFRIFLEMCFQRDNYTEEIADSEYDIVNKI